MRKTRCLKCKSTFYTADTTVTECQDCTGTAPDRSKVYANDDAARKAAVATAKNGGQTFSVKKLKAQADADDATDETTEDQPKKRKPRKNKGDADAPAG